MISCSESIFTDQTISTLLHPSSVYTACYIKLSYVAPCLELKLFCELCATIFVRLETGKWVWEVGGGGGGGGTRLEGRGGGSCSRYIHIEGRLYFL